MSDYNQSVFFGPKDALTTGDPAKKILGTEVDNELSLVSSAIASKFDTNDFATQAQAEAGTSSTVIMSPLRSRQHGDLRYPLLSNNLSDVTAATARTNLGVPATTLTLTAGVGLSGGGDLSANRTFTVDLNELGTETSIAAGDFIAMVDITDSGSQKITFANIEATLNHDSLAGFVANEHINHTSVSISAGNGLTGGGTIAATRTLTLGTPGGLTQATTNAVTASSHTHSIGAGIARFSSATGGSITVSTVDPSGIPTDNDIWIKREV